MICSRDTPGWRQHGYYSHANAILGLVGGPVEADFFAFGNANGPPVRNYLAAVNIQIDNKAISRRRQAYVGDQC